MKVRFSVLIPVFNIERYVRQTIDSVLSQSFTDYEVIVIDDGSTDQTLQVLESYGKRIKLIRQPNQGPEVARNKGAALAHGEYLAMLDHDDLFLPYTLATYDQIIRTFDSPPLIIGSVKNFRDGQSIPAEAQASRQVQILRYPDYLSKDVPLGHFTSQIVIRKSVFDKVGGYGNSGVVPSPDDVNLLLKVGTYGPCIVVQKPYTFAYREYETQGKRNLKAIASGILGLARSEHQGRYPGGRKRRSARYAVIGGLAATYAVNYCWRGEQRKLALRLLLGTVPMVFAAICKKFLRYLRQPTQPIVLPEE